MKLGYLKLFWAVEAIILVLIIITGSMSTVNEQRAGNALKSFQSAIVQGDILALLCLALTCTFIGLLIAVLINWVIDKVSK